MNVLPVLAELSLPAALDDNLFRACSTVENIALYRYSTWSRDEAQSVLNQRLLVQRLLGKFFDTDMERTTFVRLQRKVDFYISGSQALQFFLAVEWADSDLDLFLWPGTVDFVTGILGELGYTELPFYERDVSPYIAECRQIQDIVSLHRITNSLRRRIQLIVCKFCPLDTILQFHSTAVMNFITWEYAISLFPISTLQRRKTFVCHGDLPALSKYSARGFMQCLSFHPASDDKDVLPGDRRVGDSNCLVIRIRSRDPITNATVADLRKYRPDFTLTDDIAAQQNLFPVDARFYAPATPVDIFLNTWSIYAIEDNNSNRFSDLLMANFFIIDSGNNVQATASDTVNKAFRKLRLLDGRTSARVMGNLIKNLTGN